MSHGEKACQECGSKATRETHQLQKLYLSAGRGCTALRALRSGRISTFRRPSGSLSGQCILSPVSYSSVNWAVATQAERDEVAFVILAGVAAELFVVGFKVGHGTAQLTSPSVSAQHLLSKILVILLLEPDWRLFRQNLLHWIWSFTICRNACR